MILREYQKNLIKKVAEAWREGFRRPCIVLPCGGGKSVIVADIAKKTTDNGGRVLFIVHRKELCTQIEETFRNYGVNMDLCDIMMIQTVSRRIAQIRPPKLIITDENHHCVADSYRKIYDSFPNAYCVGVTATPVRLNGSGLGDVNDKLIVGVSAKWLIEHKFLAPYDYYAPAIADLSGLKVIHGEYGTESMEKILMKSAIYGDVISHYKKLADGKQAICYCVSVRHSEAVSQALQQAGIEARHIDGSTPAPVRKRITDAFREGSIKVLCNVDLISEGFDVPDCECAILLRPTKSLTLYIQQSMRCMRYKPNKRAVIIDHAGNVHRFGLPDAEHEWKLDAKPVKSGTNGNSVKVRQCTSCFYTHEPSPVCPNCGHVYRETGKSRKIEENSKIQLEKITEKVLAMKFADECRTMKELSVFAKNHNYKPGWCYYQAKRLGILK